MAKSKEDIKYATAQAKLSEDEALRVRYKHGTPLEGGKIAESEPVDLFRSAKKISAASGSSGEQASQAHRDDDTAKPSAATAAAADLEEEEMGDGGGI